MALQPQSSSVATPISARQHTSTSSNTWNVTSSIGSASRTPASIVSSNNTYTLPTSPMKNRRASHENYRPKVLRTCGSKPACLVNASVTYCGNNQIFAFGGFDQYTDEVYNHVLKLDLNSLQWALVDNYGDIPGVRMGHTACLWQGDKLLIHGGENEHREYLSDVVIFDLKSATWTQPDIRGPIPKGRARHAAAVYDEKLFILGGLSGSDSTTLDDICCLDLKTWTWSRSWTFVGRFDHSAWVWGGRMWVFGGIGPEMEKTGELWWLDLKSSPAFKSAPEYGTGDSSHSSNRATTQSARPSYQFNQPQSVATGASGYTANSSSIQVRASIQTPRPAAPGSISSMRFISGPNVPVQSMGSHFHVYSSGAMLDFVTPGGTIRQSDCTLSALELNGLQWQKLAEGPEIFDMNYRWHYCAMNEDGTKAWLLGCANENPDGAHGAVEEYLSDILPIDLKKYGLLGNEASEGRLGMGKLPTSDRHASSDLSALGADLASMFDRSPESGVGTDFIVTGEKEDHDDGYDGNSLVSALTDTDSIISSSHLGPGHGTTSAPIHVHKLMLQSRWPHFSRVYAAQMAEFHTKKMHIPEPYPVVRAFLYYLYTDSIAQHTEFCPTLDEVAGMIVMANIYDMPRLRLLCVHRLSRELDVESAAIVWEKATLAGEEWLRRRAASFCMTHWGRLVRTEGFRRLSRQSMMELCEVIDVEGRVIGGDELEVIGGLGGNKIGSAIGTARHGGAARRQGGGMGSHAGDEMEDGDEAEDEGMEMN